MVVSDPPISRWFVAQTKPGGAARAEQNLSRQGFEAFVPRQRRTRRSGPRLVTRTEPVFPGYVFIRFDPASAPWSRINNTFGISRLLMTPDRQPAPLPDGFVAAIQLRCDSEGNLRPETDLAPGDRVRVMTGPFADAVAEIESRDSLGRVAVLLDLLGRAVRVTVDAPDLRRHP